MAQDGYEYDDSGIRIIHRDEPEVVAVAPPYVTGAPEEPYDPDPFGIAADEARHAAEAAARIAAKMEGQLRKKARKGKRAKLAVPDTEVDPGEIDSAGFWRRAAASIADGVILGILQGALTYAGMVYAPAKVSFSDPRIPDIDLKYQLFAAAVVFAYGLYLIWAVGHSGQTPGKKLLGFRIVRGSDFMPIGFWRSLYRYLIPGTITFVIVTVIVGLSLFSGDQQTIMTASIIAVTITSLLVTLMYLSVAWSYNKIGMIDRIAGVRAVNIRSGIDPLNYDV